jgi:hypothetical protein
VHIEQASVRNNGSPGLSDDERYIKERYDLN